jgi:SAM-dependent methyltransferase
MASTDRFGYEWHKYSEIIDEYEKQFLAWIVPLKAEDFRDTRVLDAGCGTGRNLYWPLQYGAREVVGFDLDPRTVAVARENLASFDNATIEQRSIYEIEYDNEFDRVQCIGVMHHLADPAEAMRRLVRAARPGGTILIWVYGREGFTWLKYLITGVRRITCRLPIKVVHAIAYPFSALIWSIIKLIPTRHPYLRQFKKSPFWHIHSIVFDQLLPEIAHYWSREESLALFDGLPVTDVRAEFVNKGSWAVSARKVEEDPESNQGGED